MYNFGSNNQNHLFNYIIINDFNENSVREFKNHFELLRETDQPVIPIYIDTFGGEIYSLLAILDIIENADRPVATIALGKAMSCGSILLACGTKGFRFMGKNATIMIHDVATFSFGKIEDLKAEVNEAERLNNLVFDLLDKKCGQRKGYFKKLVENKKHANCFFGPEEAKKHKLIDVIGIPNLNFTYSFDINSYQNNEEVVLRKKSRIIRKSR